MDAMPTSSQPTRAPARAPTAPRPPSASPPVEATTIRIPVKSLTLMTKQTINVPGKGASVNVNASPPSTSAYVLIWFEQALRHHRIEFYAPGDTVPTVRMVHESWATWEPLT